MNLFLCTVAERSFDQLAILGLAGVAIMVGQWRLKRRARSASLERISFEPSRLKMRRRRLNRRSVPLEKRYPELAKQLANAAQEIGWRQDEVTPDDVHDRHPIPAGVDPRIMAAAFRPRHLWVRVGYARSRRKSRNGGIISVWRLRREAMLEAAE